MENLNIHTLANGATVLSVSPHGFRFSDGTESGPQSKEVCDKLTLRRESRKVGEVAGMSINETKMVLSKEQLNFLSELSSMADIVILPFPVLVALREMGNKRDKFPNCVAFNATPETMRSPPNEKVVDINNWSY